MEKRFTDEQIEEASRRSHVCAVCHDKVSPDFQVPLTTVDGTAYTGKFAHYSCQQEAAYLYREAVRAFNAGEQI